MRTPHKHAELIKAWADGAEIEVWHTTHKAWIECNDPRWNLRCQYRIKPEPKPDVVKYIRTNSYEHEICEWKTVDPCHANLRLTFDGETGKLKAAEVLK